LIRAYVTNLDIGSFVFWITPNIASH
jgi:hypothetical protein